ncbi:hypothetical protein [Clostridium estertheticum]|uniref:hypothetical protein n=1 Tax=Clostridium estertheticum TaxID=238834 RepID=UPI001C0DC1F0|nr:hypothetical protein [Clostridium estertheticum]MBU3186506.1 hypothetical protein [Clostridium estertheticum]
MQIENMEVFNLEGAFRGMRNPMESYDKSDSRYEYNRFLKTGKSYILGEKDLILAQKLIKAGKDHRKFMRQILVSMDITASMSFWWDIDTYKISTEKNSTSRMHKLTSKNCRHLTIEDFNWDHITQYRDITLSHINALIDTLQSLVEKGQSVMSEAYQIIFTELINDLPEGYLFTRHWTGNYEVLISLLVARKNHKQEEIRDFCVKLEDLPYYNELLASK